MSSPSSFNFSLSQQHRLKKGVPDGSRDFQKVLVTILSDTGVIEETPYQEIREEDEEECCYYDEDFVYEILDSDFTEVDDKGKTKLNRTGDCVRDINKQYRRKSDGERKNNNNVSGIVCEIRKCKTQDDVNSLTQSPIPASGAISPSLINIFDCNGELLYDSESPRKDNYSSRDIRLPSITQVNQNHRSKQEDQPAMGTTCSTGLYDRREWHDIIGKDGMSQNNGRKRGKPLTKKHSSKEKHSGITSQPCTCKYRISDSSPDPVSEPIPIPGAEPKDKALPDSSKYENVTIPGSSPRSRSLDQPSPISRSVSPNQGRFSKILSFKKHSSSPKPEASHRLLVRRSYSPKSRANSMEEMIRQNNDSIYRQRSHSWSNGKLGSKPTVTPNATTMIHSPILSPVAHHSALVPTRLMSTNSNSPKTDKVKDKMFPEIFRGQAVFNSVHEHGCPLYKHSQLSPHDCQDDIDDTITPVARRRAVSESHTLRTRQKARRAAASAGGSSPEDEHLHVRWADEDGGSSLSTSVFLTSIRPRSYSHGAECNVPHRPILKKVIIS